MKRLQHIALFTLLSTLSQAQVIEDPIPNDAPVGELGVVLEPWVTLPETTPFKPGVSRTRLAHLREVPDGSGRIFMIDLRGAIFVVKPDGQINEFVDLRDVISRFFDTTGLGTGLNGFDFHPDFASNGLFYTSHNELPGVVGADVTLPRVRDFALQGVITEWKVDDPSANVWSGSRREILRVDILGTVHGFQEISFNKTAQPSDSDYGNLYICFGDGGSYANQVTTAAYRLDSLQGMILRINPLGTDSRNGKYGIPAGNPWANDGDENTYAEIYARGFRNPHRISWDLGGSHQMFVGDIGETNIEEINLVEPGRHYGWPEREGTFLFKGFEGLSNLNNVFPLPADDEVKGFTYPVIQFDHDNPYDPNDDPHHATQTWVGVVGGFVYRGESIPYLKGMYIFGEIVQGVVYYAPVSEIEQGKVTQHKRLKIFDPNLTETTVFDLVDDFRCDLRLGQDLSGEMYVFNKRDGIVRKMLPHPDLLESMTWADYPKNENDDVNTEDFLGWLNVRKAPYAYSYQLEQWFYLPEGNVNAHGAWAYVSNQ